MPKYHSVGYISSLWHFCCLNQTKGGLAPSSQLRNVALSFTTSHCARSCKVKSFEVEVCFTWSFCGAEIMVQQNMAGSNEFHGSTNQNEIESTDLKVIWRFNILNHIPNIVCRWCSFFWLKEKHFQVHIRPSFPMNPGNRVSWVNIRVFVLKCRKLAKKKTKSNALKTLKLKFPVEMALSWGYTIFRPISEIFFRSIFQTVFCTMISWISGGRLWLAKNVSWSHGPHGSHEPLKRRFRVKNSDVSQKRRGDFEIW